ncbi:MAG TPA: glycosyltransferase family 2 protein [Deltaproteobacteria bacterium]|nr:MAG: glycosyl transferase family 2 [Deltaproteobacteria bacterium GWA2_55_82]OGQ63532.1 MAG: glycosyl transferase family 2 [Deltaproteobacteria bacterium RIFCSPLOWO2_02_FULL_55_12]OIJ74914.1 MAG: glycosyl transferase family 2 [Deltaproteobacteria bacterium GWC2_55_46]HBG47432.1 glycosyltransferase family 2 protein [Deltaproteobacteria bacterium]HCY11448.1 glycosyltransferase family 2 protein [Deltaproteobacteria bacterium]
MYREKRISLVIPAYNEARLIGPTLERVPGIIDKIYVVDDCSPDNQNEVVLRYAEKDPRIELLKHEVNQGPGGAIITGYLRSAKDGFDISIVVGGDNQMPLEEVERFLNPLIDGRADYTKGNRFLLLQVDDTLKKMPRTRLFGNWLITSLTKIASGYYKTMDVVDGYTGITREAILMINWSNAWRGYGYPMDFLIRLNAYGFRIIDIPRTAIYLPGERQSQIKGLNYALKVAPMLVRNFFWRLNFRYIYRDFHPLVFFYYFSLLLLPAGVLFGLYLVAKQFVFQTGVSGPQAIFCAMLVIMGFQSLLFAMLFDMQEGHK